jgi:hypothetical protein
MKKINNFIYWTPRVLSIIFIAFMALMSLDVFGNGLGFWPTALAFFMHNIPVLILIAALIAAWKREIVGGIAFILAGVLYIGFILKTVITTGFQWYYLAWAVQISSIAFLIGILFLVGWRKKNKASESH